MKRYKVIGLVIILGVLFLLINAVFGTGKETWPKKPLSREHYAYIDVEHDPLIPIVGFREKYAEAVQDEEEWVKSPILVGLRFVGYPNVEGIEPDNVFFFCTNSYKATVVVVSEGLMDDSIKDQEKRIDLVKEGGIWKIEWAGYRQRCYRSLYGGWITGLCP
ncbi:MAG: hypothetical protein GY847_03270 [Proteobacteria bacterium]|nr:hypothetical protein [Pseudomonadota bacterium]